MLTPALLVLTLKNKEHKVGNSTRLWLLVRNFVVHTVELCLTVGLLIWSPSYYSYVLFRKPH